MTYVLLLLSPWLYRYLFIDVLIALCLRKCWSDSWFTSICHLSTSSEQLNQLLMISSCSFWFNRCCGLYKVSSSLFKKCFIVSHQPSEARWFFLLILPAFFLQLIELLHASGLNSAGGIISTSEVDRTRSAIMRSLFVLWFILLSNTFPASHGSLSLL